MAPVATDPIVFNTERDGLALEETSDKIDTVNVLKANLKNETAQSERDIHEQAAFDAENDKTQFRQYEAACDRVNNFYREQYEKQTVAYNLKARNAFKSKTRTEMTIWEAMEKLNTLIDESDPDTSLSQIEHLL
ncbi:MAG: inositol oxygenase 1 [Lasallia pustulata]|uniref:Inositol oxygenase n=1 Tax=Lasallia pustulata TaxID=136370 RepID=A0A1W5D2J8_9LECA|nr:MAG: inositol oxygenase 1 [Lasallia pustulata]SLM37271.1 inositol oxygenase [Lasallia pustulata]